MEMWDLGPGGGLGKVGEGVPVPGNREEGWEGPHEKLI